MHGHDINKVRSNFLFIALFGGNYPFQQKDIYSTVVQEVLSIKVIRNRDRNGQDFLDMQKINSLPGKLCLAVGNILEVAAPLDKRVDLTNRTIFSSLSL